MASSSTATPQARVQQVKAVLADLLAECDSQQPLAKAIQHTQAAARDSGGLLLPRPRRGAQLFHKGGHDMLAKVGFKGAQLPADDSPERAQAVALEQWREAEALLLAPHTIARLKELPELQQLISFTAVAAVTAAGAPPHHAQLAASAASMLAAPAEYARAGAGILQELQQQQSGVVAEELQRYKKLVLGDEARLLDTLSPHMQLTLAADVAAGMLCPG